MFRLGNKFINHSCGGRYLQLDGPQWIYVYGTKSYPDEFHHGNVRDVYGNSNGKWLQQFRKHNRDREPNPNLNDRRYESNGLLWSNVYPNKFFKQCSGNNFQLDENKSRFTSWVRPIQWRGNNVNNRIPDKCRGQQSYSYVDI